MTDPVPGSMRRENRRLTSIFARPTAGTEPGRYRAVRSPAATGRYGARPLRGGAEPGRYCGGVVVHSISNQYVFKSNGAGRLHG